MNLKFVYPGAAYSVESCLPFMDADTPYWREPFYQFHSEFDRTRFERADSEERRALLTAYLERQERAHRAEIAEKLERCNAHWSACRPQIVAALEDRFGIPLDNSFNDMEGRMSFNPISPRYLDERAFDVFWLNSERGALGMALHEIIHFVWFRVWQERFRDSREEYERPSLKWILSEMVVDPIMRDPRLSQINPYFADGCVYDYFYKMTVADQPVLEVLDELMRTRPMDSFMKDAFALLSEHESEIRRQIAQAENG